VCGWRGLRPVSLAATLLLPISCIHHIHDSPSRCLQALQECQSANKSVLQLSKVHKLVSCDLTTLSAQIGYIMPSRITVKLYKTDSNE